jgi:phenylacetate-CoA ligase
MLYGSILLKYYNIPSHCHATRDELLRYREIRFRKLLHYAYERSPFYRPFYAEHGITEKDLDAVRIEDLPPIDKDLFVQNFDKFSTRSEVNLRNIQRFVLEKKSNNKKLNGKYMVIHSSGCSGQPAYFVYDNAALATLLVTGIKTIQGEDKFIQLIGKLHRGLRVLYLAATEGRFAGVVMADMLKGLPLFKVMFLNANSQSEYWINQVLDFNPDLIFGYPSVLKILGALLKEKNIFLDVMSVITSGEPLTRSCRQTLEGVFLCNVTNIYAASESLLIGVENPEFKGTYLFDDLNYIECEQESTLLTPLYNYVQPLIRYRLTDVLQVQEKKADDPLPYTKVLKICGRNEDFLWFPNKDGQLDFIHPLIMDELHLDKINSFQFIQYSKQKFAIKIIPDYRANVSTLGTQIKKQLDHVLQLKKLDNLVYNIIFVKSLAINPLSGKLQLTIKEKELP